MKNRTAKIIIFIIAFAVILYGIVTNIQLIYSGILKLWHVFSTVITALLLAFMLNVLMDPIENRWLRFMRKWKWKHMPKLRRGIAILLTFVIVLSVIAIILLVLIPQIEDTVISLVNRIPGYIDSLIKWAESTMAEFNIAVDALPDMRIDWASLTAAVTGFLSDGSMNLLGTATGAATSLVNGVMNTFFSLIMSVYILAQKERLGRFVMRVMNAFFTEKTVLRFERFSFLCYYVFSNFFAHQLLECLILGVMCYIGMLILGIPYALVISMVIAFTQLIPMVGPLIGEIIGAFILLMVSPLTSLLFLAFILILQQVENSIVYPRIVGKSVGLPGLLTFITVIVGSKIGGLVGAFLGVPIVAVGYFLLQEAIEKREQDKAAVQAANAPAPADPEEPAPDEPNTAEPAAPKHGLAPQMNPFAQ